MVLDKNALCVKLGYALWLFFEVEFKRVAQGEVANWGCGSFDSMLSQLMGALELSHNSRSRHWYSLVTNRSISARGSP